jgi:hypothetical protein
MNMFSFLLAVGSFCSRWHGDKEGCRMEMRWCLVALKLWCRWYVCVIVGCMTMVWQGSCWGSQKVAAEGFVEEKINNVGFFCFGRRGKLWE